MGKATLARQKAIAPLAAEQDADIRRLSEVSHRSQRIRARRAQLELGL